ncbi:hypothetical protein [Paraburkholderia silvatlantica]|uniref:hypothetical protein n=1 Tax=Paraburkholderia silvatlantica TaxID=321895 RepID=UPI003750AB21
MTSHHFNIETIGIVDYLADTFAKLAAKGKLGEPAAPREARDARYRPPPSLARRAQLGLSLTQTDAADINASNEAPQ